MTYRLQNSRSEYFNRKVGKYYMFGEVTMFLKAWSYGSMLKICAPKTYEL